MKVFISWSGETSKAIAEILRQWLPSVIQVVRPYYSPDDITKGTRWSSEIAKELEESAVGLICLTKDNLISPWIMFEAGALSKNIDRSKVCPLLFGVDPTDIEGPLVQFQAARFTKEEVKKVVRMINTELADGALSGEVFDGVFEMWWPKLEERIQTELKKAGSLNDKDVRGERDILEEILSLTRRISLARERSAQPGFKFPPEAVHDLVYGLVNAISALYQKDDLALSDMLGSLIDPVSFFVDESELSRTDKRELHGKLERGGIELRVWRAKKRPRLKVKVEPPATEDDNSPF